MLVVVFVGCSQGRNPATTATTLNRPNSESSHLSEEVSAVILRIHSRLRALKGQYVQLSGIENAKVTKNSIEYRKGEVHWPQGKAGGPKFTNPQGCILTVHITYPANGEQPVGAADMGRYYPEADLQFSLYLFTTGGYSEIAIAVSGEVDELAKQFANEKKHLTKE